MKFVRLLLLPPLLPLLILCASALSGCRFGNYSEPPKGISNFNSIELFHTQITQFETYAIYTDGNQNQNTNTPLSAIPGSILNNFTDPLFIAEPKSTPGIRLFIGASQSECMINPANSSCIGTIVNSDDTITVSTSSPYTQFGPDEKCSMNLQMQQIGILDRSKTDSITYSDGSKGTISGNLLLNFRLIRNFAGDCSGILKILADCYSTGTGCSTDELYWANQLFDLFIRQSGTLRIEDATRIKTLAYIVHFD